MRTGASMAEVRSSTRAPDEWPRCRKWSKRRSGKGFSGPVGTIAFALTYAEGGRVLPDRRRVRSVPNRDAIERMDSISESADARKLR